MGRPNLLSVKQPFYIFVFWLGPRFSHEMASQVVYGANVRCVLHHLSSLARFKGSWANFGRKPTQNRKQIKLK